MRAIFHNLAIVYNQYAVCIRDCTDSLRHHNDCCIPNVFFQILTELTVSLHIQSRKTIIKYIDFRLLHHRFGNCHAPTLTTGQIGTSLSNVIVIALLLLTDKLICTSNLGCPFPIILCSILFTKIEVVRNIPGKQDIFWGT